MTWTGNLGEGTTSYRSYDRDHVIHAEGKELSIPGSSDPAFSGDKTRYNPEELLVSAISSCHMLWYLHLCAESGITVVSYVDNARGVMEESEDGSGKFESVTLVPSIVIEDYTSSYQKATNLHIKAHEMCFIANSINFDISVEPLIKGVEYM